MILMNLFSVFDPSSYFNFSLNWVIVIMLFYFFMMKYYMYDGVVFIFQKKYFYMVGKVLKEVGGNSSFGLFIVCLIFFLYLMLSNLVGLFPYVFTWTSHPYMTLGFGLVMWMSFMLMGFFKNFYNSMVHLVPEGSPFVLSFIMVLIESISHLMRPFTLSIRLAANMMAGHLIIGLLSSISGIGVLGMLFSLFFQSMLLLLELGVALIQGLVFSILLLLYALEYY